MLWSNILALGHVLASGISHRNKFLLHHKCSRRYRLQKSTNRLKCRNGAMIAGCCSTRRLRECIVKKYKTIIPLARMVLKIIVANWLEDGVQIRPSSFQTGKALSELIRKNSANKLYISIPNCRTVNELKLKVSGLYSSLFKKIFTNFSKNFLWWGENRKEPFSSFPQPLIFTKLICKLNRFIMLEE